MVWCGATINYTCYKLEFRLSNKFTFQIFEYPFSKSYACHCYGSEAFRGFEPGSTAMSIVPKETIEVIAQSVGIPSLGADVAAALAPDVEYRLREIMQVRSRPLA